MTWCRFAIYDRDWKGIKLSFDHNHLTTETGRLYSIFFVWPCKLLWKFMNKFNATLLCWWSYGYNAKEVPKLCIKHFCMHKWLWLLINKRDKSTCDSEDLKISEGMWRILLWIYLLYFIFYGIVFILESSRNIKVCSYL